MEYYLSLNLLVLHEWDGLDPTDHYLAAIIEKYEGSRSPGLKYTKTGAVWIDHGYLLRQLPALRLNIEGLRKRLRKLVKADLIDRDVVQRDRTGKRAYYRMSATYKALEDYWRDRLGIAADNELSPLEQQARLAFLHLQKPKIRPKNASLSPKQPRNEAGKYVKRGLSRASAQTPSAKRDKGVYQYHSTVTQRSHFTVDPNTMDPSTRKIAPAEAPLVDNSPAQRTARPPAPSGGAAAGPSSAMEEAPKGKKLCPECGKDLHDERTRLIVRCQGCEAEIPDVIAYRESLLAQNATEEQGELWHG